MTNPTGPYGPGPQQGSGQPPASSPYAPTQAVPAYNPQGQQGAPQQGGQNPYGAPAAPQYGGQTATQAPPNPYGAPQPGPNPYGAPVQNPYGQLGYNAEGGNDDKSLLKRLGVGKMRLVWLIVVVILAGGAFAYNQIAKKSEPQSAHVGDCLNVNDKLATTRAIVDSAKKVACTDPGANYKVIARVDGTTDLDKCSTQPGYKEDDAALAQEVSKKSFVLCLEPTNAAK